MRRLFRYLQQKFEQRLTLRTRIVVLAIVLITVLSFTFMALYTCKNLFMYRLFNPDRSVIMEPPLELPLDVTDYEMHDYLPPWGLADTGLMPRNAIDDAHFIELKTQRDIERDRALRDTPPVIVLPQSKGDYVREEVLYVGGAIAVLLAVLSGVAAYLLAGFALRPVRRVSKAACSIDAGTLDKRLALKGPNDDLKRLSGAFDEMLDRLQLSFEQQGRFVADAAHELRTPIATLRTNIDVLRRDPNATVDDYHQISDVSEHALVRIQCLVNDLLLLAMGESPLVRTEVSLGSLVEEVVLDLEPVALWHNVTLRSAGGEILTVHGDVLLLARCLSNLVENAIRYNHVGGEVVVSTHSEQDKAFIIVADTGIGISPEHQDRIFDRFYRVDWSRSREGGGVGLGLSIAAHLVQLHNGQLQVKSVLGQGSEFTIVLPIKSSEPSQEVERRDRKHLSKVLRRS